MDEVVLDGIGKRFTQEGRGKPPPPALSGISLSVRRGEFVVLVGPSGCGKSTALRIIAGLEEADSGTVTVGGKSMANVAPQDRDLAMVFQGYALYPQMTVREILEFPLKMRNATKAERTRAVDEAAALLRIDKLLARRPGELSGGERQRVAMGRAIVRKPRLFLFDEPLSNLDAALRGDLRLEIGALVRRLGATAIYVTHDHVEAMTLADRIAVMRAGKLLQFASPRDIYQSPITSFVGTFLGSPKMNVLSAEVSGDTAVAGPFRFSLGTTQRVSRLEVGIRPESIRITDNASGDGDGTVETEIVAIEPLGAETHFVLRAGGVDIRARAPGFDLRGRGDRVRIAVDPAGVHFFDPAEDGARLVAR